MKKKKKTKIYYEKKIVEYMSLFKNSELLLYNNGVV